MKINEKKQNNYENKNGITLCVSAERVIHRAVDNVSNLKETGVLIGKGLKTSLICLFFVDNPVYSVHNIVKNFTEKERIR